MRGRSSRTSRSPETERRDRAMRPGMASLRTPAPFSWRPPMNGKRKLLVPAVLVALVLIGTSLEATAGPDDRLDAEAIASASGTKVITTPDGVVRIAWPRTDVPVKVDGHPLRPFA